jgi:hypothetical protein
VREREPYSAALDKRFASETQPDPNPPLHYVRFRANRAAYAYSLPSFEINLIGTAIHGEYLAKK